MTYDFAEQYREGQLGENELDEYFRHQGYEVTSVTLREELDQRIDRRIQDPWDGNEWTAEYKTDSTFARTENFCIEIADVGPQTCRLGWAYACQADRLYYYVRPLHRVWTLTPKKIRAVLPRWLNTDSYRLIRVLNRGYWTYSLLVPRNQVEATCMDFVFDLLCAA